MAPDESKMLAAIYDRYGAADVVTVSDRPMPRLQAGRLLVRVKAAALNPKDVMIRAGRFGLVTRGPFPRGIGHDFAGVVEGIGAGVSGLKVGDEVFGMTDGLRGSTVAQYVVVRRRELALKPPGLGMAAAASMPLAALTALQSLRDIAGIRPGSTVLINGAAGGVGVHAIQIAKILGASVVAVSGERNLQFCRDLGADETIDYNASNALAGTALYDCVFDVFGNRCWDDARGALRPDGVYISTVIRRRIFVDLLKTAMSAKGARLILVRPNVADLDRVAAWVSTGKLRPVVDCIYPMSDIAAAQRHIETKHSRGKVVIAIPD